MAKWNAVVCKRLDAVLTNGVAKIEGNMRVHPHTKDPSKLALLITLDREERAKYSAMRMARVDALPLPLRQFIHNSVCGQWKKITGYWESKAFTIEEILTWAEAVERAYVEKSRAFHEEREIEFYAPSWPTARPKKQRKITLDDLGL